MKKLVLALSAFSMIAGAAASPALAVQCRKAGKFVKCPEKPKVCRNAKGHYAKCAK